MHVMLPDVAERAEAQERHTVLMAVAFWCCCEEVLRCSG